MAATSSATHVQSPSEQIPRPSDSRYTEELSQQLQAWSDLIPGSVRPDFDAGNASEHDAIILLRFHAAGDIIFRPTLISVLRRSALEPCDAESIDKATRCLHHCRAYLSIVELRAQAPHASLEITLHSALAAILLLTRAALSPWLCEKHEVEGIELLQEQTIHLLRKWAFTGSSIEAMLNVALAIGEKYNLLK
ncbi:hypothetical protein ColLi_12781 [Colletotrichum liriopes]|uniref:Uncharacterized protein n=1 Tax=Colletotrichum liriopes TaxID=708192 RepID=A0AA37GZ05_9PEZI|nr:hypothetical protein ColLi_12781 [Colletotrichum liriopes]